MRLVDHDDVVTNVPITLAGNKCPFRSDAHLQRAITAFPALYVALKTILWGIDANRLQLAMMDDDGEPPPIAYARGVLRAIEEEPPEVVPQ